MMSVINCRQGHPQNNAQITYIANEGFLISVDGIKILIDALFKSKNYTSPSDSLAYKIINNIAPVDNINYLLVTHSHPDHFDGKMIKEFLSKNTKTKFISTSEACSMLADLGFESPRLISQSLEFGETKEIKDGQISVTAFRLDHGSREIDNLAYIIKINDYTIMHVGDAFILQNEEYINKINWDNYKIDFLFVGYMDVNPFVLELLDKTIKPKVIIMMHIHEEDIPDAKERNSRCSDRAILFEKELDTKSFDK